MVSKTGMLELVRNLRWKKVEAGLAENPKLIDVRDDGGRNWLHVCCSVNPKKRTLRPADSVRTAGALLDAGLALDAPGFCEGEFRATPLWYAIARGENPTLAKYLLGRGADPNHCLWAAAYWDDTAMIKLLAAAGAVIDAVAEDETPFLHAVKTSRFRAAKVLLELGANVDFQDSRGMTALHYMLKKRSDERHFRMVAKYGPRGDLTDRDGATAAHLMSRKRSAAFREMAAKLAVG